MIKLITDEFLAYHDESKSCIGLDAVEVINQLVQGILCFLCLLMASLNI